MSDNFMLTPEELRRKRRNRRLLIGVGLVLAAIALFFGGRPAVHEIKAWQARRHAEKAFALIAKEKWSEARGEAIAAYQLWPAEPQALRAVARFLSRTRQPEALDFWKKLQDRQSLTREDLRDETAIALAVGDTPRADDAVQRLISSKPEAADWLLAVQLSVQKGAPEDAKQSLEKIFNDPKATEREQLQAVLFQFATSQDSNQVNDAQARLEKLSRGQSQTALDALVVLARRALANQPPSQGYGVPGKSEVSDQGSEGLSTLNSVKERGSDDQSTLNSVKERGSNGALRSQLSTISDLAHALEAHPLAKAPQKLLALDLLAHADPTQREQLIARAIAAWKDADATSLSALAAWLNAKGEYQKTIETIPLDKALQVRDLFLQHLDALGALGRWSEIKRLLMNERYPLDQVVQLMYLARCSAQLGEKTSAENNWKRALEAAGGDAGKLMTVADYAEKNGNLLAAQSAFEAAAAESPKLRPAQQGRLRAAQASRDTRKIHDVLADMLRLWPNDPAVQNDEAYLRLLLMPSAQSQGERRKEKGENQTTEDSGKKKENAQRSTLNSVKERGSDGALRSQLSTSEAAVPAAKPIAGDTPATTEKKDGDELAKIEQIAAKLVQREPASMPHRTLLALARLRQNRAAEALDVYSNIQVAPNALTASTLAVHAAVLAANGRMDDAKAEVQQIKVDNLVPEERALLEQVESRN